MTTDVGRPHLHFTTQAGWINDPLGLTFHDGRYHLFFQFVPGQTEWGPEQHWGHATSEDLLHWTEGPVALSPGDGDGGVWSGSVAVPEGQPAALFYTSVDLDDVQVGRVRVARPTDDAWTGWVKKDVVAELPADLDAVAYRDPYVFHDGACWRMLLGAGFTDGTAAALTYRSDDLEVWSYDGLLATRHRDETEPVWTGAVWECPQMVRLGDRWVLTVSVWEPFEPHYEAYAVGDLVDGRFTAESWHRLTFGPSYYAGAAYTDAAGAPGLVYWLRGIDDPAGRWASAHSVPHALRLEGGRVTAAPHPQVALARQGDASTIRDDAARVDVHSDVVLRLDDPAAHASLILGDAALALHVASGDVTATTDAGSWTMPVDGTSLRILLDGPVVEIFTAGGTMAVPIPCVGPTLEARVAGGASADVWSLR
ncbi:glycoside hydrolase family 32 protein [Actinotalea solisilvae]|uniref:glycoside hydrolase family 32 protein n=1 Tax=Actinotalea solisilvae TaxID=2072922 RepID=UPI0018F2192C|nr:glycoside hydrolase family 32 protein [Actinotalea solisilvae]